jgi:5-formyltetrahydrofolate cyclo-ligase
MTDLQPTKAAVRAEILARRDALPLDLRIDMSLSACGHGLEAVGDVAGKVVAGFLPIRSEIDLRPLLHELRVRGATLCLPAVVDRTTIVFRRFPAEGPLVATGYGTLGPGGDQPELDPAILLMPLAAFDRDGNRLGYGAGHYDRAIARLRAKGIEPERIGFAFSCQEAERVPAGPHDVRMNGVVTELGVRVFFPRAMG